MRSEKLLKVIMLIMAFAILLSVIAKNERYNDLESKVKVLESQNSNLRQAVKDSK